MAMLRMSFPRRWAVVYYVAAALTPLPHTGAALAQAREPLELMQTIALPDVRGRIDHLDIDLDGERLFVAGLGNKTREETALRRGHRIRPPKQPPGPRGVPH